MINNLNKFDINTFINSKKNKYSGCVFSFYMMLSVISYSEIGYAANGIQDDISVPEEVALVLNESTPFMIVPNTEYSWKRELFSFTADGSSSYIQVVCSQQNGYSLYLGDFQVNSKTDNSTFNGDFSTFNEDLTLNLSRWTLQKLNPIGDSSMTENWQTDLSSAYSVLLCKKDVLSQVFDTTPGAEYEVSFSWKNYDSTPFSVAVGNSVNMPVFSPDVSDILNQPPVNVDKPGDFFSAYLESDENGRQLRLSNGILTYNGILTLTTDGNFSTINFNKPQQMN